MKTALVGTICAFLATAYLGSVVQRHDAERAVLDAALAHEREMRALYARALTSVMERSERLTHDLDECNAARLRASF